MDWTYKAVRNIGRLAGIIVSHNNYNLGNKMIFFKHPYYVHS